jgi:hypothetical protein
MILYQLHPERTIPSLNRQTPRRWFGKRRPGQ